MMMKTTTETDRELNDSAVQQRQRQQIVEELVLEKEDLDGDAKKHAKKQGAVAVGVPSTRSRGSTSVATATSPSASTTTASTSAAAETGPPRKLGVVQCDSGTASTSTGTASSGKEENHSRKEQSNTSDNYFEPIAPGAVAVLGPNDSSGELEEEEEEEEGRTSNATNATTATADTQQDMESGLAVASPVKEEMLHRAVPDNTQSSQRMRRESNKRIKSYMLLACLAATAMIVFIVAITISSSTQQQQQDEEQDQSSSSPAPSPSPTLSLQGTILSLLPTETVEAIQHEPADASTPQSPQSQALAWLLEDPFLPNLSHERILQKFALATLFFATHGEDWWNHDGWLNHSIHECDWYNEPSFARKDTIRQMYDGFLRGFSPYTAATTSEHDDPTTTTTTHQCDDKGLYQHLWLDAINLQGTLPEELYMLTHLRTLSLSYNAMQGTLSNKLGTALTSLEGVGMTESLVGASGGPIPSELGLLTNTLRALLLTRNNLEGSIPAEIWQLTNLDMLLLGENPFVPGTIPTKVGNFKKLRWLLMDSAGITGTIPTEIGTATSLEWIIGFQNELTGTLPGELKELSHLELLSLRENHLQGSVGSELGVLDSLFLVELNDNQFSGGMPSELGLLTNLNITLALQDNLLSGAVPTELGNLALLKELQLHNNQLTGQIPSEFGQLESMGRLTLGNNSLSGPVPPELSSLQHSLFNIQLEGNPWLSGSIPDGLCSINGTCALAFAWSRCQEPHGLSFDCNGSTNGGVLCGCDCPCSASSNASYNT